MTSEEKLLTDILVLQEKINKFVNTDGSIEYINDKIRKLRENQITYILEYRDSNQIC